MAFDPLTWAAGFALTKIANRFLYKIGVRSFADDLRRAVTDWASELPSEFSDLHPEALAERLFGSDLEKLGPNRRKLRELFEDSIVPPETAWFDAIEERWYEVRDALGKGAQSFFKVGLDAVEPHIRNLARILHRECIKNEDLFKVSMYKMVGKLVARQKRGEAREAARRPANGLGVLSNVPKLPQKFVPRPEQLQPLKEQLLGASDKAVAVTAAGSNKVGIQGMGGIGKTVQAAAAVRENEVRKAYPDGIIWLTLGQQPNLIARQVQLAKLLGDEKAAFQDIQQGKARLEELLRDLVCLVVLDDVWDAHHVSAFDVVGEQGRILITTRFRNIVVSVGAQEQRLDVLEKPQSLALLAQWAGTSVQQLPPDAHKVVKECGGLPLALAMIGAMIQRRPERWDSILQRLRDADLDKIKQDFPDYPYPDLLRAIGVSIDGLDEAKECYLDFAIFPEDTPIPEKVLQTLWQANGLKKYDVQDVLDLLEDRSMLQRDETARITLHDLQIDYVRKQAAESLADRRGRLLDAYWKCCTDGWHTGPVDGYFYQHLAYHLCQAGKRDDLKKLLFDYRWLDKKLEVADPNGLLADYDFLLDDAELNLVQGAIRLSAHVLVRDKSQLPGQLVGRLMSFREPEIQKLLGQAAESGGTWLRPLSPSLPPPCGNELRTLVGHTSLVMAVSVTPDGRRAISGSFDHTLKVWNLETGDVLHTLSGHSGPVTGVSVTLDGRRAVSRSDDMTLKVWDLDKGKLLNTLRGHMCKVTALSVTPDSRRVVSGSDDKTLRVWDLDSAKVLRTLKGNIGEVRAIAIMPDGWRAICSEAGDGILRVWDLDSGSVLRVLEGHSGCDTCVSVTPGGHNVISGGPDCLIKVWDVRSGELLRSMKGHRAPVTDVSVTPDGLKVVSGSEDDTLKIWAIQSGELLETLIGHRSRIASVSAVMDNRRVISGSYDGTLKIWTIEGRKLAGAKGHTDFIWAVAVTPDCRRAISGSKDCTLKIWDLETGQELRTLKGHTSPIYAISAMPDSRRVVSKSEDHTLIIWDIENGRELKEVKGHPRPVCTSWTTREGRRVYSDYDGKSLKVRDERSGEVLEELEARTDYVQDVKLMPDGLIAISLRTDNTSEVLDLESGKVLGRLKRGTKGIGSVYHMRDDVRDVLVMPDGRKAISMSDRTTLIIWDIESGEVLKTLTGHTKDVWPVSVTPDGRKVISGSDDKTLKVWDVETGRELRTLKGHRHFVRSLSVTPDGRRVISGSADETVKVWDIESGQVQMTLRGHCNHTMNVLATPDGCRAIVWSSDDGLKVWDLRTGEVIAAFDIDDYLFRCAVAPDGLTIVIGGSFGRVYLLRLENVRTSESSSTH